MTQARLHNGLTPLAARLGVIPLFGDIHNHCNISYGHGSLTNALLRARQQLDFVSITGHAAWPDMPVEDKSVAHIVDFHVKGFGRLKANWHGHFAVLFSFDEPGRFTVFPGYEIHSNAHGDYTVVYADLEPDPYVLADDPAGLKAALLAAKGSHALAFPHHIGYRPGARGINWSSFDPELSPFVEMFSMHGCAEDSLTSRPYLHSMGPLNGPSSMAAGLADGHLFGVVGNTDHHSGYPGSYGHGRMGVYASANDREAIFEAMRARRTNALTGNNIHLLASVGDTIQGGILAPTANAELAIEAIAGDVIDRIDIIRNGRFFERISPALTPSPIGADETLVYLEMGWGARGSQHRWQGDIEVRNGAITGLETRLRGAEIVSPLEGEEEKGRPPRIGHDGRFVGFELTAGANPNNVTPATQGFAIRIRYGADTALVARFGDHTRTIALSDLFAGSLSGNLGAIDSPAYRFHQAPRPDQWQWQGTLPLGPLETGETIYVRLTEAGGQNAWTSPFFVRTSG